MVQAAGLCVNAFNARGDARQAAPGIQRLFRQFHRHAGGLTKAFGAARFAALFGHAIERHFRLFDLLGRQHIFAGIQGAGRHVTPHAHQFAQQGEIIDLLGKITRPQKRGARACQLRQIRRPTQRLHGFIGFKHRLERHGVSDHRPVDQPHDGIVNAAMDRFKEMFGPQFQLNILCHAIVDHQRAQQRGLCLDIMGQLHCGFGIVNQSDRIGHGGTMPQSRRQANRPQGG